MTDLILNFGKKQILSDIHKEIQEVYLNDQRPWVIGYSGGKDSTLTAMLVIEAISQLPKNRRTKNIYILSTDTMVENPLIKNYIKRNIDLINEYSTANDLRITAKILRPQTTETFWTLLLGKGYPSPRQKFRWCTHRMKIKPMDEYINNIVEIENTSVIVVLGVRSAESNSRRQSIENHSVEGKLLKTHSSNSNAFVYAPIETLSNDDVWSCLLNSVSPWGFDNNLLLSLYRDASDESECPIQQDVNAPSCGQSRFGCWVCTVVSKDKSLSGFIQNEYDELRPLLKFRNHLTEIREQSEYRQNFRMNGSIYFLGDAKERRGLGPYSIEGRKKLFAELLVTEKSFNQSLKDAEDKRFSLSKDDYYELITHGEMELIRKQWIEEGDWNDSLPAIYESIMDKPYFEGYVNQSFISNEDQKVLQNLCNEFEVNVDVLKSLITLESKYVGINHRSGITSSIEKILNKDIVHEELISLNQGEQHENNTDLN